MGRISSHSYVVVEAKVLEDAPRFRNGNLRSIQIPTRAPANCDHASFICSTQYCVSGWAIDYNILFDKTIAGRRLKRELGVRELLYRPSWQALRVSFLKEHRDDGGWTTMNGTRSNLDKLGQYIRGEGPYDTLLTEAGSMGYKYEHEYDARLYRAINCLNAVRMGYSGAGTSGSDPDYYVLDVRDSLQKMQTVNYHRYLTYASKRWDWRVVKTELQQMVDGTPSDFRNIQKNLLNRMKGKDMRNRPELETFLLIMEEVQLGD